MNEVAPQPNTEIAPSVAALLELFHEQTSEKLAIAPVDSVALCHLTTGIVEVNVDGSDLWTARLKPHENGPGIHCRGASSESYLI